MVTKRIKESTGKLLYKKMQSKRRNMSRTELGVLISIILGIVFLILFIVSGKCVQLKNALVNQHFVQGDLSNSLDSSSVKNYRPVYPKSRYITGIEFNMLTLKNICPGNGMEAPRSDNWTITWADDGNQYTAWGDGGGFGGTNEEGRVSMGVAKIEGNRNNYSGYNIWGGKNPISSEKPFGGKSYGIISIDGSLYMLRSGNGKTQQCYGMQELWKSRDHGESWKRTGVDWNFPFEENTGFFVPTFLQFGKDYKGARDEYVYIYAPDHTMSVDSLSKWDVNKPGRINLIRVPKQFIEKKSAYSYFAGTDSNGKPIWSSKIEKRLPVFSDSENGVMRTSVIYNPGLKRYILTVQQVGRYKDLRGEKAHIGIYESTEPWGPWSTILFEHPWNIGDFPHLQNEKYPGDSKTVYWNFSPKWWYKNGRGFVMVYTGPGGDQWGSVEGTFTISRNKKK